KAVSCFLGRFLLVVFLVLFAVVFLLAETALVLAETAFAARLVTSGALAEQAIDLFFGHTSASFIGKDEVLVVVFTNFQAQILGDLNHDGRKLLFKLVEEPLGVLCLHGG